MIALSMEQWWAIGLCLLGCGCFCASFILFLIWLARQWDEMHKPPAPPWRSVKSYKGNVPEHVLRQWNGDSQARRDALRIERAREKLWEKRP